MAEYMGDWSTGKHVPDLDDVRFRLRPRGVITLDEDSCRWILSLIDELEDRRLRDGGSND